jgi:hypothetical protein
VNKNLEALQRMPAAKALRRGRCMATCLAHSLIITQTFIPE